MQCLISIAKFMWISLWINKKVIHRKNVKLWITEFSTFYPHVFHRGLLITNEVIEVQELYDIKWNIVFANINFKYCFKALELQVIYSLKVSFSHFPQLT